MGLWALEHQGGKLHFPTVLDSTHAACSVERIKKKVETELIGIFEVVFVATLKDDPKILNSHWWKQRSHPGVLQLFQTPVVGLNPGRWLERYRLWNICNSWWIEGSPAPGCHRSGRHESRQVLHGVLPDKHNSVRFYTTWTNIVIIQLLKYSYI